MKQKRGVRIRIHIFNKLYSITFIKLFSLDNNMNTLCRQSILAIKFNKI